MATENCISDWDLSAAELRRCSGKRQRTSSEADLPPTTISKLGTDLLVEILIRLPSPRSACRCKIVCKEWGSLICSPRFNRRFVSHHQTMNLDQPTMPVDPYELLSVILSFLPPMPCSVRDSLRVLDCNKDLVLCGFWDIDCDDGERGRSYLVCNPFTKQWIALPLAPKKIVGYVSPAARLVCEPRISNKLDLGDDQTFVYSEYRFRVVCIYQVARPNAAIKLDLFCSETGEWTEEALVCDGHVKAGFKGTVSCNGELFWRYYEKYNVNRGSLYDLVAIFNPFRLDMPPTSIDALRFIGKPDSWSVSGSQGVFHVIVQENSKVPTRLSVWRLEEDRKSLIKQCEGLVNKTSKCGNYEVESGCHRPLLHPHKPGIVFFNPFNSKQKNAIFCCDLRREEIEFLAKVEGQPDVFRLQVFQPRVSCWATPIPRYAELRGVYDGTYSFWVQTQSSSEARTPSLPSSLNICKDEATKSALYKDYTEHVTEEVTEIIQYRENGIGETVLRERQQPHFLPDMKSDVLEADLKDGGASIAAISKPKELKHSLLCETSAVRPYPPAPIRSVSWRPSSWWVPPHKREVMLILGDDREKWDLRLMDIG